MAVKNYMINDKWLDIAKQNIVEVQSTDGVIGSVKVNGQEYGGGGSSDFSTAEVTIIGTENNVMFPLPTIYEAQGDLPAALAVENVSAQNNTYTVPLYKGVCDATIWGATSVQCTGNAEYDDGFVHITGDCTITIS